MIALRSLAALGLVVLPACGAGSDPPPTRIVLITLDTLRADGLAAMPETAAYARRGMVFESFYAATSTTQPTHASLFTGLHPWQHGVTRNGEVLAERYTTLAERLQAVGFETSAVVASYPMNRLFGFAQGFDRFHDEFHEPYVPTWLDREVEDGRFYSLAEAVTEMALAELEHAEGELQFFWFHYFDPHDPYGDTPPGEDQEVLAMGKLMTAAKSADPSANDLARRARELYDADGRALDRELGRLYRRLDEEADELETHVVVTSDHGESFGELGCLGHGKRLVPSQVHVPCILVSPRVDAGTRRDTAGSVDVFSTLLTWAGLDASSSSGRDLTPRVAGETGRAFGMRSTFAEPKVEHLVDGRQLPAEGERFFAVLDGELLTGDLERVWHADDLERVADDEAAADVRLLFAEFSRRLAGAVSEEILDEDVQAALRALGYGR